MLSEGAAFSCRFVRPSHILARAISNKFSELSSDASPLQVDAHITGMFWLNQCLRSYGHLKYTVLIRAISQEPLERFP